MSVVFKNMKSIILQWRSINEFGVIMFCTLYKSKTFVCDQSDKSFPHYNILWVPEEETEGSFLTIFQDLKLKHLQSFNQHLLFKKIDSFNNLFKH